MSKRMSYKDFLDTFKSVPRLAINLLVKNKAGEIVLSKRAIFPLKGYWHYPGSFLVKGEKMSDCLERVAKDELGIEISMKDCDLLGVFENLDKDPRGHIIDAIYSYKIKSGVSLKAGKGSAEVKFFKKLPPKVGFNHIEVLNKLGYK